MALILVRWNRPSDFLTFHCRRNFALACAAFAVFAAAVAAAASKRGVVALFRGGGAAAVIKLVAGSPMSSSAMVRVSGIVITKVVADAVTVRAGAAGAGWIGTSVQMKTRHFGRSPRTA